MKIYELDAYQTIVLDAYQTIVTVRDLPDVSFDVEPFDYFDVEWSSSMVLNSLDNWCFVSVDKQIVVVADIFSKVG